MTTAAINLQTRTCMPINHCMAICTVKMNALWCIIDTVTQKTLGHMAEDNVVGSHVGKKAAHLCHF